MRQNWIKLISLVFSISALFSVSFGAQCKTQNAYIFGIHPYLTAKELLERFTPLINYLSDQLNKPVVLRVAKTYRNHIEQVGKNQVDIAYLGPAPYVKLVEKYGHQHLLAKIEVAGESTFRGVIIVSKNSQMTTLSDLQGKGFAFGSPNSTMSHFVPRFVLWQAGITLDHLSHYQFIKSHENVVLGVLLGEFEAGAIKKDIFNRYAQQDIKVLTWTPPITVHLFVATHRFPQEHVEKLQELLLNLNQHPQGKTILTSIKKSITGLRKVKDQDYNELRYILSTVEELKNKKKSRQ
jgi:phosphonate transport system substrate-binding protein